MSLGFGDGADGDGPGLVATAAGRAMLLCGLIWIWLGSGIVRSGSVLGRVMLSGRISIGSLESRAVNSGLAMGRAGPGLFFVGSVCLGSLWQRGLAMLSYDIFSFGGWAQASCGPGLFWAWFGIRGGALLGSGK